MIISHSCDTNCRPSFIFLTQNSYSYVDKPSYSLTVNLAGERRFEGMVESGLSEKSRARKRKEERFDLEKWFRLKKP